MLVVKLTAQAGTRNVTDNKTYRLKLVRRG